VGKSATRIIEHVSSAIVISCQ